MDYTNMVRIFKGDLHHLILISKYLLLILLKSYIGPLAGYEDETPYFQVKPSAMVPEALHSS
jgi:hypothetical protein